MVAGAAQADLLQDLAAAADRAIAEGKSLDAFRRDFKAIVARNGWTGWTGDGTPGGEAWRTRTIYWGNTATSYAAGRVAQLREGGFPLCVYHHNDSVANPRPQHVSWNGLALPPDHPFWSQHYPPGGWGCECWVSGARNTAAVRRQGGDPDEALPDGWDAVDPKTGAPVGIDRGWDYMPGDTVSDTVRQMAAKTQQWEYTLAKAYMQHVPEAQRDALSRAYRDLPSVATDTRLYAQRILEGRTGLDIPSYRTLGLVTQPDASLIHELAGVEVGDFDFALDPSAVKHIAEGHGVPAAEATRGQRPIKAADYARLPELINGPDTIEDGGRSGAGRPVVRYRKRIGAERWTAVFEVQGKRKMIALKNLWVAP